MMLFRHLSFMLVLITLLAACGGAPAAPAPTSAPAAADAPAPRSAPASSAETRTITHPLGTTEVPANPERIVAVTGTVEVDALVDLGVIPIAAAELEYGIGFSEQAAPALEGITMLPTRREINLELVALQQPDLIIGTQGWLGDIYPELSAIAPTVGIDDGDDWKGILRQVATIVGRESVAEERIAEVEAAIADLAERYAGATSGLTYTLMKPFPADGEYGLYRLADIDPILQQLGMVRPQNQIDLFADDSSYAGISTERVDLIDTDVLFLYSYGDAEDETAIQITLNDPLVAHLDAVANDKVFVVNSAHWYFSSSLAMEQVLADLEQTILPQLIGSAVAPASTSATRTITHVLGSSEVPANPQRIAVLDNFALEAVLALGLTPVGAVYNEQIAQQPFIQGRLDGVENLGEVGTPNLERLLALDPDLILTINVYDDFQQTYEQLSQIAPTVPVAFESSAEWKEVFMQFAAALGRDAEAEELLAAYDARTAAFRDAVGATLADTTVSIVRVSSDGSLRLYLRDSFSGVVLSDAGLRWPETQPSSGFAEDISKERLDLADADVIFLWTANDPEGEQAIADLQADPLWQQLQAVQNERVYAAPRSWIGSGILAANAILDDLDAAFGVAPAR